MKFRFFSILTLVFLSYLSLSCVHKTVSIHSNTPIERKVLSALRSSGHKIIFQPAYHEDLPSSHVVILPRCCLTKSSQHDTVQTLKKALPNMVVFQSEFQNYSFDNNIVGILFSASQKTESSSDPHNIEISKGFSSQGCESNFTIDLYSDGHFILDDLSKELDNNSAVNGDWALLNRNTIELYFDKERYSFYYTTKPLPPGARFKYYSLLTPLIGNKVKWSCDYYSEFN